MAKDRTAIDTIRGYYYQFDLKHCVSNGMESGALEKVIWLAFQGMNGLKMSDSQVFNVN